MSANTKVLTQSRIDPVGPLDVRIFVSPYSLHVVQIQTWETLGRVSKTSHAGPIWRLLISWRYKLPRIFLSFVIFLRT